MPRTRFTHLTETGKVETRESRTRVYTHVIVIDGMKQRRQADGDLCWTTDGHAVNEPTGERVVYQWSMSQANAEKGAGAKYIAGRNPVVETINGGER